MTYAIMSVDTANIVNTYPSEDAALAAVRRAVERYGRDCAEQWALLRDSESIAFGHDLVERARARIATA